MKAELAEALKNKPRHTEDEELTLYKKRPVKKSQVYTRQTIKGSYFLSNGSTISLYHYHTAVSEALLVYPQWRQYDSIVYTSQNTKQRCWLAYCCMQTVFRVTVDALKRLNQTVKRDCAMIHPSLH